MTGDEARRVWAWTKIGDLISWILVHAAAARIRWLIDWCRAAMLLTMYGRWLNSGGVLT